MEFITNKYKLVNCTVTRNKAGLVLFDQIISFEKFKNSLAEAVAEAQTGAYREDIIKFFEQKDNERARWILQELKKKGQSYKVAY